MERRKGEARVPAAAPPLGVGMGMGPGLWRRAERRRLREGRRREKAMGSGRGLVGSGFWSVRRRKRKGKGAAAWVAGRRLPISLLRTARRTPAWAAPGWGSVSQACGGGQRLERAQHALPALRGDEGAGFQFFSF